MTLVILTEESSMKEVVKAVLPKIGVSLDQVTIIEHQGVSHLESSLQRKLKGWTDPNANFLVLRDNDNGDCHARKSRLVDLINASGRGAQSKVRIVCQELEAWFIGDKTALESSSLFRKIPARFCTRDPDQIMQPSRELSKLCPGYGKVSGASIIARHLDPERNRSASFHQTVSAIRQLIAM
jgi:hypothetical protein